MSFYIAPIDRIAPLLEDVKHWLDKACIKANELRQSVLVSCSISTPSINPLLYLTSARTNHSSGCFWSEPGCRSMLTGIGVAWEFEQAANKTADLPALWYKIIEHSLVSGGHSPKLFGGLRFDSQATRTPLWQGFEDTSFVLHRFIFEQDGDQGNITVNIMVEPRSSSDELFKQIESEWYLLHQVADQIRVSANLLCQRSSSSYWTRKISDAVSAIGHGAIEKVVMARSHTIPVYRYAGDILRELCEQNQNAYVFAFFRQGRCFMGASPEKLAALYDKTLTTMALAGSSPRHQDAAVDLQLGEQLLNSAKDLNEHGYVVQLIHQCLARHCVDMDIPQQPRLLKLPHVQHLYTPIQATIAEQISLLEIVYDLHPTPAVGGLPVDHAVRYIRESEELDRGWYAAPVGYLDRQGGGTFIVALRSALLDRHSATLFAGCGIVKDSDPMKEWLESQTKMKTMASAIAWSSLGMDTLLE